MAVPVARVHLAMAHAALPGLLPTPHRCMMFTLLPAPPCAVILPCSPPRPSRADAAGRWDAHKISPAAGSSASSSSSSRSSCETRDSNKKNVTLTSPSRNSSAARSNCNSRADSVERCDAHKKPATSSSSKTSHIRRRPSSRAPPSSAERWDAHKKAPAPQRADELDDGENSTGGSSGVELDTPRQQPPRRPFYAGPGFITSPEPIMLPKPSFMIRVA